jgi:hypothetical protein
MYYEWAHSNVTPFFFFSSREKKKARPEKEGLEHFHTEDFCCII